MRRKWYRVYAENGFGEYLDYSKLLNNSKYTRGEYVRKFDTRGKQKNILSTDLLRNMVLKIW